MDMMMTQICDPRNERLLWSYTQRPVEKTKDFYDDWAPDYDQELLEELDYVAPQEGVAVFGDIMPDRTARIMEAGCGTGLVGRLLAKRGYVNVHGNDLSPGMLHHAARTGAYQSLHQHDLRQPVMVNDKFDAALCIGVYAFGPIFADDFTNVLGALKPNAPFVVTVNGKAWHQLNWSKMLDDAAMRKGFLVEAVHTIPYLRAENIDGRVLVLRTPAL